MTSKITSPILTSGVRPGWLTGIDPRELERIADRAVQRQRRWREARSVGEPVLGDRWATLDEPAAGMNPKETQEITELISKLRAEGGYTILVIEHDMHVVEGISDRVIALDHGVKIAEGSFEAVATNPKVVEAYLGTGGMARK